MPRETKQPFVEVAMGKKGTWSSPSSILAFLLESSQLPGLKLELKAIGQLWLLVDLSNHLYGRSFKVSQRGLTEAAVAKDKTSSMFLGAPDKDRSPAVFIVSSSSQL